MVKPLVRGRNPALCRYQRDDGFPHDGYLEAVAIALVLAGAKPAWWGREEAWEADYLITPTVYGKPAPTWAPQGILLSWQVGDELTPQGPDDFTGPGWHWSRIEEDPAEPATFGAKLGVNYLATPTQVAQAVARLLNGGGNG